MSVFETINRIGWTHAAGGTGPYLSLKARLPELRRREVDDAVFKRLELLEVPAARDSVMLVPRADLAVALAAGRRGFADRLRKVEQSGIERKELDALAERIVMVLDDRTLSTDQLRAAIPPRMIRELGEAGRQLGLTTTLPVALRLLQLEGRVIRLAEERRLDGKLHFYRVAGFDVGAAPDQLDRALAERFVRWSGSAAAADFAWWAGIGKRAAAAAIKDLLPGPVETLPGVRLLPYRDNHFTLRHGTAPEPHHNTIIVDGDLAGLWEYDHEEERIVYRCKPLRGLEEAVAATEAFIREELGDHRFYALDHAAARAKRISEVRAGRELAGEPA